MVFKTGMKIHFNDADPAGIAFSGGLFTKIHQCFEEFVGALGEDPHSFFLEPRTIYPLRHYEGEFLKPLLPLNTYSVEIGVVRLSESSFTLQYKVVENQTPLALFHSTHVAVDKQSFQKTSIPSSLKQSLEKFAISQ